MSTTATASPNPSALDQDERVVEEVHCAECGVPMTAIPNWYATVRVRFTCDTCRAKSSRATAGPAIADVERDSAVDTELEAEDEDAETDTEDDVTLEVEDDVSDVEE